MKKFFYLLGYILVISCSNTSNQNMNHSHMKQMQWLVGTWKNISDDGELCETWTKRNDTVYSGNSFMLVKGDTVFSEIISLELKNGQLYYIPIVSGQNGGFPVEFKFISDADGEFVFENKEHDFPQRIIYKNPAPDSLYARIEGTEGGIFRDEEFSMSKEK